MNSSPEPLAVNLSAPAMARTNSPARWSLILGLAGLLGIICMVLWVMVTTALAIPNWEYVAFFGIALICGFAAIIFGVMALIQIGRSAQKPKGSGRAIAGVILGALNLLVLLLLTSWVTTWG